MADMKRGQLRQALPPGEFLDFITGETDVCEGLALKNLLKEILG